MARCRRANALGFRHPPARAIRRIGTGSGGALRYPKDDPKAASGAPSPGGNDQLRAPTLSVDRDRTATGPQVDRAWTTFTIENYDEYQSVTARSDSVTDRARTTAGPQAVHDRSADTRIYEQDQGANPSDINKGKESKEVPIPLGMGRKRRAARAASEGEVVPDLVSEVHGPTARQRLWREAPSLISALTGKQGRAATAFLGRMVSEADNDCIRVMQVVTEAQRRHPLADPESFLMAGARGGGRSRGTRPPSARETREAEFLAVLTPEQRARAGYAPAFDGSAAFDLDLKPDRENRT